LVDFYKERGILIKVDGRGGIDEVYHRIADAIRGFAK